MWARMKSGVTLQSARVEMDRISRVLEKQYPDANKDVGIGLSPLREESNQQDPSSLACPLSRCPVCSPYRLRQYRESSNGESGGSLERNIDSCRIGSDARPASSPIADRKRFARSNRWRARSDTRGMGNPSTALGQSG